MADEQNTDRALTQSQPQSIARRSAALVQRGLAEALTLQSSEAYYERGLAKYEKGDYDGAIEDFTTAIEINPGDAGAYYERGRAKGANWDYHDAIDDFSKALVIDPLLSDAYYERAMAYYLTLNQAAAVDDLTMAFRCEPNGEFDWTVNREDIQYLLDEKWAFELKEYEFHIECNPIEQIDPGDVKARKRLAKAYRNRGWMLDYIWDGEPIGDLNMAVELDPGDVKAYLYRGLVKRNIGELDGAIEDYTTAIEINPRDAEAYYNRGVAKYEKGDHDGALLDRAAASRIDHRYARVYYDFFRGAKSPSPEA